MRRKFTDAQKKVIFEHHEKGTPFYKLCRYYDCSPECIRQACLYVSRKIGVEMRGRRSYRPKKTLTIYLLLSVKKGWITVREASKISGMSTTQIRKELTQK